jgi:thiol:disulfide interchange protein DsbC
MVKKLFLVFSVLICLISTDYSHGFEKKGQDCSKCHTLSNNEARDLLKDILPDVKIFEIRLSPSKGFWEVFLESGGKKGLIYVDFSKKYLMMGSMISIKERKNLTQERFSELNKVDVSQIPLDDALVLGDPKARIRVIVFHDPD